MKKKPTTYHHGDLRTALIAAARETVERDGADAFSLRATTRELGVDIAATYRHFRNKGDVLAAVAASGFDELGLHMATRMKEVKDTGGYSEACFFACGAAYVEFGLDHPNLYRLMFGGRCSAEAIQRARGGQPPQDVYGLLGEALDMLDDEYMMAPEARGGADMVAWAQMHGFVSLCIDGRGDIYPTRVQAQPAFKRHIRVLLNGFGTR